MAHYPVYVHEVVEFVHVPMASKRRAYLVTTKLQAIEAAEKISKEAAASHFGVGGVDQVRVGSICATRVSHYDLQPAYSMKVL